MKTDIITAEEAAPGNEVTRLGDAYSWQSIAFVVGALTITGVTGSVTSGLVGLGGDNLFLVILFGIAACFIMGMAGLAIVAYIFLAVTLAPAIIEVGGLNTIAVHFFIVYYAMLSVITPPVGAAAFLAGTIAGAKP
ncbi:MAG: TRAP transporter large permease subunit, partial [Pseudomonas sp.]|nr:TRAP transporter large permease subunit [Pseudomonas sp.]